MLGNSLTKFLKLDSLINNLTGYFETKVELIRIEVKQEIADGVAKAAVYFLIAFIFALVILFLSLGVAIELSQTMTPLLGYGIVALFYLVIGGVVLWKRETLFRMVHKSLSQNVNKKK